MAHTVNSHVPLLNKKRHIPGQSSHDRLAALLKFADTNSEEFSWSVNNAGGMRLNYEPRPESVYSWDFQGVMDGSSLQISSGHVFTPSGSHSVNGQSFSGRGVIYVEMDGNEFSLKKNTTMPPFHQSGEKIYNWPICELTSSGKLKYFHFGSIYLPALPAEWVNNWDNENPKLRGISEGVEEYIELGVCDSEETEE